MIFKNFDEFYEAAMSLIETHPNSTRLTLKSTKRKSRLTIRVTNDRQVDANFRPP